MGHHHPALSPRDTLIIRYRYLVTVIAWRLKTERRVPTEIDDLIGNGTFGLIHAAERYDPDRGVEFTSYAWTCIQGAMLDGIRKDDWAPRKVTDGNEEKRPTVSLDVAGLDSEVPLKNLVATPEINPSAQAEATEAHAAVVTAIDSLPRQQQVVIAMYYYDEINLADIGVLLGLSESRISQIVHKAVVRMRYRIDSEYHPAA